MTSTTGSTRHHGLVTPQMKPGIMSSVVTDRGSMISVTFKTSGA
jgi:hypothetical protein